MQLPTTCMGTNQVQVEAVEDRPRPTAWYDGVGKRPIINNAAHCLCKTRHAFVRVIKSFRVSKHAAVGSHDKPRAIESNNTWITICATKKDIRKISLLSGPFEIVFTVVKDSRELRLSHARLRVEQTIMILIGSSVLEPF